ncbi:DOMON-like domain-containing protein [Brevundimonas sp. GCM10030266]|uniref:DOMON-like domain-containing protein n=1 Tax=Brevundimonas sp. GCM10030266 TaxID=3273386 RepID=UPI00360B5BEF
MVEHDFSRVPWPAVVAGERADGLWQHTCFEAFIPTGDGYLEFNMSPSCQWASYHFESYRSGMKPAEAQVAVRLQDGDEDYIVIEADLDLPPKAAFIGLSAVIEDIEGNISYWALAHAPGKPDFHHPDSFALVLPAPELP